jgi:hypothetical protein
MIYKPRHFKLEELACPHIFAEFKDFAWQFFDDKLLWTLDLISDNLGLVFGNNWHIGGEFDERGFRCIRCDLVKKAFSDGTLYVSPHMRGIAEDFDVKNMTAQEVRDWLMDNQQRLQFPIRLERNVNWVHLDTQNAGTGKVFLFDN